MSYEFLEHEADMGILCSGATLAEAFEEGGRALFDIMVDLKAVKASQAIEIECTAPEIPELFVEWLNELLSQKDLNDVFFSDFKVNVIAKEHHVYHLIAKAFGEKINLETHGAKIEVKAATYSGLKYEEKGGKHILQCVVDL